MAEQLSRYQVTEKLFKHWRNGEFAEANELLKRLSDLDKSNVNIENEHFGKPITIGLPELHSLTFVRCRFDDLKIEGGSAERIRFEQCDFNGKRLEVLNCEVRDEFAIVNDNRETRTPIAWEHVEFRNDEPKTLDKIIFQHPSSINTAIMKLTNLISSKCEIGRITQKKLEITGCKFTHDFSGYFAGFPPDCEIELSSCVFDKCLNSTSNKGFQKRVTFKRCDFTEGVRFKDIHFNGGIQIIDTDFKGIGLVVNDSAMFGNANATGDDDPKAPFGMVLSGTFSNLSLRSVRSNEMPTLIESSLKTSISQVIIENGSFKTLKLKNLRSVSASFRQSKDLENLELDNCNFDLLKITDTTVKDKFLVCDSTLNELKFKTCVFEGPTVFRKTKFGKAPLFDHCKLFFDTAFRTSKFKDKSGESEGPYRQLKNKMAEIGNEGEETRFASYEIRARMKNLGLRDWLEWFFSVFYFVINRCGTSIAQPLVIILALVPLFYFGWYNEPDAIAVATSGDLSNLGWVNEIKQWEYCHQALLHSVLNTLGPIRLLIPTGLFESSTPSVLFGSTLQILLSSVLWFFFIFGIRRRFRVG